MESELEKIHKSIDIIKQNEKLLKTQSQDKQTAALDLEKMKQQVEFLSEEELTAKKLYESGIIAKKELQDKSLKLSLAQKELEI
ncbi:hypothetical protein [Clostridium sp. ZS2-4]|uniref:hypothetical protein n=1 Tax=Clostridium sp. ZS2-4 TaxID=2987703 RepID=UPI00227A5674|nr:hypothetical protein [Clostridium sp. ZS2-4]MCY6355668.1 hypothetical protein [Clostridium sp. ZS2-4]